MSPHLAPRFGRAQTLGLLAAVFIVTVGLRGVYLETREHGYDGVPLRLDNWAEIAEAVADGQGYTLHSVVTGERTPTAYRPPVYPLLLAAVYRAGGTDRTGLLVQCVLDGLTACLIFLLGRLVWGRTAIGLGAALLYAVYLPEFYSVVRLLSEPLFTLLLTLLLYTAARAISTPTPGVLVAAGMLAGLLSLTRPTGFVFALLVLAWWCAVERPWGAWRRLAIPLAGFLLVLTPWVVRNAVTFEAFIPLDTTGGFNAYVGTLGYRAYVPYEEYDPELAAELRTMDELGVDRRLRREAWENIRHDPRAHAERSLKKTGIYFFRLSDPEHNWIPPLPYLLVHGALFLAALAGWWTSRRTPARPMAWLLVLVPVTGGLVHSQIVAHSRLVVPVLPAIFLLAAAGAAAAIDRWRSRHPSRTEGAEHETNVA